MNRHLSIFFFLSVLISLQAQIDAQIHEIDGLNQIMRYVENEQPDLVLFDIDDTLLHGLTKEATNKWFCARMKELMDSGLSSREAAEQILPTYTAAQCSTRVEFIDLDAPVVLQKIREKNIHTLVITTRGRKAQIDATLRQFSDLGLSFKQDTDTLNRTFMFDNMPGYTCYIDGIIFCDGNKKSIILAEFFNKINYTPKHIVFIDDELGNILALEALAKRLGIRFEGFHFLRVKHLLDKLPESTTGLVATS